MGLIQVTFGASKILWGADTPIDLGETLNGGEFLYKAEVTAQLGHSTGKTAHRFFVAAREVNVKVNLLEDVLSSLLCTMSDGQLREDGGDPTNKAIDFLVSMGAALPSDRLTLRPRGAVDGKKDIVLWKATLLPELGFVTSDVQPRVYRVNFQALVDEDQNGRWRLARFGDVNIQPTHE